MEQTWETWLKIHKPAKIASKNPHNPLVEERNVCVVHKEGDRTFTVYASSLGVTDGNGVEKVAQVVTGITNRRDKRSIEKGEKIALPKAVKDLIKNFADRHFAER